MLAEGWDDDGAVVTGSFVFFFDILSVPLFSVDTGTAANGPAECDSFVADEEGGTDGRKDENLGKDRIM